MLAAKRIEKSEGKTENLRAITLFATMPAVSDETRDQDENEESTGASVMEMPFENEGPAPWSEERMAVKEAIRLDYVTGKRTLAASAIFHRIPYDTITGWSKREEWGAQRQEVGKMADHKVTTVMADWMAEQKNTQIRPATLSRRASTEKRCVPAWSRQIERHSTLTRSMLAALWNVPLETEGLKAGFGFQRNSLIFNMIACQPSYNSAHV